MPETPDPPSSAAPASAPPRRLRGAPLHNLNALKHGFYARKFRQSDLVDLADSKFKGLNEEMNMLRVFMRGVIEKSSDASTLAEALEVLKVLSLAAASLTRMARTQKFLDGSGVDSIEGFSELLAGVNEKLRREGVHE